LLTQTYADEAFSSICKHIDENILRGEKLERMTMLRDRYLMLLADIHPNSGNLQYTTQQLKRKLVTNMVMSCSFGNQNQ